VTTNPDPKKPPCEECGVHHEGKCVRSLQEQGQMQWEHLLSLESEVHRLGRGRSLEHERGTQFVVHVTLDEVKVSWLDQSKTASKLAEDIGVVVATRLGFKRCTGATLSHEKNEQTWARL
jgi:hypothetical protein